MVSIDFVTAGKAIFTVANGKGEHFTYRVVKNDKNNMLFAYVLSGPDNTSDYTYMGFIGSANTVVKGNKGINESAKSVNVLNWAMKVISGLSVLPNGYTINHIGACGRCGRPLTDPTSIETGLGPTCRGK